MKRCIGASWPQSVWSFYHQRHAAVAEDIAQLIQLLIVEEMAKGELQPQSVQSLRFREQRREIRVKLAVVGEQRLRRGVAGQQAVALNGGRQRGQSVELFRAAQLADFDAVRAGVGDKRQDGGLPACLTWSLPYAAVTTIIFWPSRSYSRRLLLNLLTLDGIGSMKGRDV